jgi:hypothetical protein
MLGDVSSLIFRNMALTSAVLLLLAVGLSLAAVGVAKAAGAPGSDATSTTLSSSASSAPPGGNVTITAYVADLGASPTPPIGVVSWSDEGAGGIFSATTCTLSPSGSVQSECSVTYTNDAHSGATVEIVGSYAGDLSHSSSAGLMSLPVFAPSTTTISPSSLSVTSGQAINFTATVTAGSTPQGAIFWNDENAGGSFSAAQCSLVPTSGVSSACEVTYRAPSATTGVVPVTVSAEFTGDALSSQSSGQASLMVLPASIPMTVNYEVVGNASGSVPPAFTYQFNNVTTTVVLTRTPTTYQVDLNSPWFVPNQLGNSSARDAWNLVGGSQGAAAYPFGKANDTISITFVYYHQYLVNLGYKVVGGTSGASIPPLVTFTSFGVTKHTGPPGQTWVDVGTPYAYPALIPGSLGGDRWIAQNVSGIATPGDLSPTYYHQYSLSVSFVVKDSPGNQAAPTFFGVSMGSSFNASVSSLTTNVWLDAGSQYSFTDPLAGGSPTVRWSAGSASSGFVTDSDIAVTYYPQNSISASFKTADGSVPAQVKDGVSTPILASLVGVSGNRSVSVPLTAESQQVWLDSGTVFSISKVLLANASERWVASGAVNGTVTSGSTASQTYYHEYLLKASYSSAGATSNAPSLTYTLLGAQTRTPLTTQGASVWADAGSQFFVADALAGDRWFAPSAPNGVASANITVTYYHQYMVNVSLMVAGSGLPAQTTISGVSGGQQVKDLLGTESESVWLDSGTSYSIPRTLLTLTNERWIAQDVLNGTVSSPAAITQEFFHQVLLNISSSGVPSSVHPIVSYVSFGADGTANLGPAPSGIWADAGTAVSVQNAINGTVGERWYSAFPKVNVSAPLQSMAQYFHQYLLAYSFTAIGGTMSVPPTVTGVAEGKNTSATILSQGGDIWLDGGSVWRVTLAAATRGQSGSRWESGSATQGMISAPTTEQLAYYLQYLVSTAASPASGGTVTSGGWYNASSNITVSAAPAHGWTLGGWSGAGAAAYTGANATFSISVTSIVNETVQFDPGLTVISSNGGSVKYVAGTSVQSLGGGQSVQTFVPVNGSVTLQARATFPYQFVRWSGVDATTSSRLTLNLNAPTQVEAIFAPSYADVIGIPAAVFVSGLTTYIVRRPILASGRHFIRQVKEAISG